MPTWQTTVERHLERIKTYYLDNDAVQREMAVGPLVDQFATSLDTPNSDPLSRLNVVEWREQFTEVASTHRTSELGSVIQAISASEHLPSKRSMIALGVVTLISTLVDCRTQFSITPIEEPVTPLIETIETAGNVSVARENLAVATERTADVARLTGLAAESVDTVSELEFPHPEVSTEDVQTAIRDALERNEEDRIETLGRQVVRSANCEWTQSDLTEFVDEKRTGGPFERLLEALCGELGYEETAVTNDAGGDGGIDVVASDGNRKIGIEAKRYQESQKIRAKHVRKLGGTLPKFGFDEVFLVTSTTVDQTDQAAEEAAQYEDLTVVDGETLASRLSETSLHPPVFIH